MSPSESDWHYTDDRVTSTVPQAASDSPNRMRNTATRNACWIRINTFNKKNTIHCEIRYKVSCLQYEPSSICFYFSFFLLNFNFLPIKVASTTETRTGFCENSIWMKYLKCAKCQNPVHYSYIVGMGSLTLWSDFKFIDIDVGCFAAVYWPMIESQTKRHGMIS